jgi:hypothetical protein
MNTENTFTFDMLGASPTKLRRNLLKFAKHDAAFKNAFLVNRGLKKGGVDRDKAIKTVKLAKRYEDDDYPQRFLFALKMFRSADFIDNERIRATGDKNITLGIDYGLMINDIRDKILMGADPPGYTGLQQLRRLLSGKSYRAYWVSRTNPPPKQPKLADGNIKKIRKFWKKMRTASSGDKKKLERYIRTRLKKTKYPPPEFLVDEVFGRRKKLIKKQEKARKTKIMNVVKVVADVAVKAAKIIPGVKDAVEAAENAVKQIPGVSTALEIADKVRSTVKEAKRTLDTDTIEKVKDLGMNDTVRKALAVDKLVNNTVKEVVAKTKMRTAVDLVQTVETLGPPKVKAAIELVKAAREMDPMAIAKVKNIQALADSGLYEAQKAIETMRIAMKIQNTAKQQALATERQWVYY